MTNQSINSLNELLDLITSNSTSYYIEQNSIASKEEANGHTIYSRFKKFNGKITDTLIKQHQSKDINLAISLEKCNAMVFEYSGKHQEAFISTLKYIISDFDNVKLYITTHNNLKFVVYTTVNFDDCVEFTNFQKKVEKKLEERLIEDWKILPSLNRPKIANLFVLPREFIEYK